jgi:hypothetical protein
VKLGVVTQVRNESKRVLEWINFHKKVGFERFVIFDDDSSDNLRQILEGVAGVTIERAVEFGRKFETDNQNNYAGSVELQVRIRDSLKRGMQILKSENFDWAACIDVDEFIVPTQDGSVVDYLSQADESVLKVYIASFDMRCPIDLNRSVIEQSVDRWSEKTRVEGSVNGTPGWFCSRGKSIVNLRKWDGKIRCVHWIDVDPVEACQTGTFKSTNFTYSGTLVERYKPHYWDHNVLKLMISNDEGLRLFHYRNDSALQTYDEKDTRALDLMRTSS